MLDHPPPLAEPLHPLRTLGLRRVVQAACWTVLSLGFSAATMAQSTPSKTVSTAAAPGSGPRASDPTDAMAAVPPARHRSSLAGYRRLDDVPVSSWPAANEVVNRIGGWRTYAREAARSDPSATPPAPAPAASDSGPLRR